MATPPKPDDKTHQVPVGAEQPPKSGSRAAVKTDPKLHANPPALGFGPDAPSYTNRDLYAGQRTDVKPLAPGKAAAAEVSQGAWRERAFAPRGVMSPEEILKGLEDALAETKAPHGDPRLLIPKLRDEWLQFLRQAVEQAGGDSLDGWLAAALKPDPHKPTVNPVLLELFAAFRKMRDAATVEAAQDAAREAIAAVRRCLDAPTKRPCSFKVLERELEGKIDVDGLLAFLLSSDDELTERAREIGQTLERIRDEVKKMPGAKPDGMYSNFARLKAEARLIDGELKRRGRAAPAV